jgi:hypothetical protein
MFARPRAQIGRQLPAHSPCGRWWREVVCEGGRGWGDNEARAGSLRVVGGSSYVVRADVRPELGPDPPRAGRIAAAVARRGVPTPD